MRFRVQQELDIDNNNRATTMLFCLFIRSSDNPKRLIINSEFRKSIPHI
jgi:hypothetical protein